MLQRKPGGIRTDVKKTTIRPLTTPADATTSEAADKPARATFGKNRQAAGKNRQAVPRDPDELDFNALRTGGAERGGAIQAPRWMFPILIATALGILAGAIYYIIITLDFKNAISANQTSVLGPYPSYAVIFVIIPAFCGPFYILMDYLGARTGIPPFTSVKGLAATALIGLVLVYLSFLPVKVIRHKDNVFAGQHGYTYCSSVFDPQRVHVYALASYVAAYGCPTVAPQQ